MSSGWATTASARVQSSGSGSSGGGLSMSAARLRVEPGKVERACDDSEQGAADEAAVVDVAGVEVSAVVRGTGTEDEPDDHEDEQERFHPTPPSRRPMRAS